MRTQWSFAKPCELRAHQVCRIVLKGQGASAASKFDPLRNLSMCLSATEVVGVDYVDSREAFV